MIRRESLKLRLEIPEDFKADKIYKVEAIEFNKCFQKKEKKSTLSGQYRFRESVEMRETGKRGCAQ